MPRESEAKRWRIFASVSDVKPQTVESYVNVQAKTTAFERERRGGGAVIGKAPSTPSWRSEVPMSAGQDGNLNPAHSPMERCAI